MRRTAILALLIFLSLGTFAQTFKYAFVTDTHVGSGTGEEDLRRTVADINEQQNLDFIVITGDITEMGTNDELKLAKSILAELRKPYYIIPGNHDTGWSESGGVNFIKEFGNDKFVFDHKGYRFIACASGPYVRMSDGHIPRDATVWLEKTLKSTPKNKPIVFLNHYPLDNSLDNWYEATDRLKKYNIQYALCGHGHNNHAYNFEGIEATMGRSNLRAKDSIGGYNIVTMTKDSVFFATKKPTQELLPVWRKIVLHPFTNDITKKYTRPVFTINTQYPNVKPVWTYHSGANVVNTPAYAENIVVFGNSLGLIEALNAKTGKKSWTFQTQGAIYSSPIITQKQVIVGSGDGNIYSLNLLNGKVIWKSKTNNAVLGSPVIDGNLVLIGGSDHTFRALDIQSGKTIWEFNEVEGSIVDKPLIYQGKVIFGSWGRHLYALDLHSGKLLWKWNNGHGNRMFSPAMCTPVATKGIVYISAPDRYLTAIDANNGNTLWRNKEATVRESIGLSADSLTVYGKTMQDEIVGYKTQATDPGVAWRLNVGFGYEHIPSMLIEKEGQVFFGTKNGTVYAIDPLNQKTIWGHKVDNSMVNTVNVIDGKNLLMSTMDGKVSWLKVN
ncbi:outer membrane protein assembly factor BamB family protein [Pedobacter rhizosphaerae]|uniref:Outer membrane protein assembly factor BamB, contains PQQ-like beta-propeller repeat n=1 Tax=Pedobacter rhizosphaerae TaxID=390241 RepID=A0A1H9PE02_9SPHI|nr:PQQ-binding-like beta-propeller repeat protein [Pedobacter rhizosphaerae]SER46407.1 Outer membrane protein assembly factor BamB, contains PQQ-like beta-propeller repeat [Pedobacter rhizosphaerae]